MLKNVFYRNARARDLLDAFLVSAVTTVLLVRFYLHITGYPQIGGGQLHIAHMLYGGLLMMGSIVLSLTFLGTRTKQVTAIVGGVGFGIFIDELGKFVTEDNNYFFRPTIGLIYAVFVILYLGFNFLTRSAKLTSKEYQLNALNELEEAVALNLDKEERNRLYSLIEASDPASPVTRQLKKFVDSAEISAQVQKPSRVSRFVKKIDTLYRRFWRQRHSNSLIAWVFAAEVILIAVGTIYTIYINVNDITAIFSGNPSYGEELLIGQVISSVIAAAYVIYGLTKLSSSRLEAFEQFRRATLINIYLTQFFVFARVQFEALPGLILNLILLLFITFVIRQETRLSGKKYVTN